VKFTHTVRIFILICLASIFQPAFASDFEKGIEAFKRKEYESAAGFFEKSSSSHQDNGNSLYYEGLCEHYLGKSGRAKSLYQMVLSQFPTSPAAKQSAEGLKLLSPMSSGSSRRTTNAGTASNSPASAATGKSSDIIPDEDKVPFVRSRQGDMIVNAAINGKPIDVVFDTGADGVSMSKSQLIQIGLTPPSGTPMIAATDRDCATDRMRAHMRSP
jgi:Aspartyl protease